MEILVTGSEGFIGKALVDKLKKCGHTVFCIDKKNGDAIFDCYKIFDTNNIKLVYHLAAKTSVFNNDLFGIESANIRDFMIIATECEKRKIKLIYASSSTAFNKNTTSMYGLSKRFNEEFASIYCPTATGVRLHNVYGKNQRENTLLGRLINGGKITIYNNGLNFRHFTYLDDTVDGLIKAYDYKNEKLLNIACPYSESVKDFINNAKKYIDNCDIEFIANIRDFDVEYQEVNKLITTIELDYKKIDEGLRLTLEK